MVELVLQDARFEVVRQVVERLSRAVEPAHAHRRMARHQAAQIGDRQVPLPVVDQLAGLGFEHRIDHHVERNRALRVLRFGFVDEELLGDAHLQRRQFDAFGSAWSRSCRRRAARTGPRQLGEYRTAGMRSAG
jgi:hypothetical protein